MEHLIWIIPVVLVIGGVSYVSGKVRHFSRALFGTEDVLEGLRREKQELSNTPRSLRSMEPVYLPRIQSDFPTLNIDELKKKAERVLLSSLQALAAQDITLLSEEASPDIREKIMTEIAQLKEQGLTQHYRQVKLYRTVIHDYRLADGLARLRLHTALESFSWLEKEGSVLSGDKEFRSQLVFETVYLYVQDVKKVKDRTALALSCPSCGAPVRSLGRKVCDYCGNAVKEINLRVWRLTDYKAV